MCVSAKVLVLLVCVCQKHVCVLLFLFVFFKTKCPTNIKCRVEWEMFGGGQRRKIHYMVNRLFKGLHRSPLTNILGT